MMTSKHKPKTNLWFCWSHHPVSAFRVPDLRAHNWQDRQYREQKLQMNRAVQRALSKRFPKAISVPDLVQRVTGALQDATGGGYQPSKTLVTFSICADELNRTVEEEFSKSYGELFHFNMGGLAGFPFTGLVGFGAMCSHIPDRGDCLIVYGPHVGVDQVGIYGRADRLGMAMPSTCCGSGVAAKRYIVGQTDREAAKSELTKMLDSPAMAQQGLLQLQLLPFADRLQDADDINVELPQILYELIDPVLLQIVQKGVGLYPGHVALVGGIQINTPPNVSDYFVPLRFDLLDQKGENIQNLLWDS